MDDHIFEQLDRLQAGARMPQQPQYGAGTSEYARHNAYDDDHAFLCRTEPAFEAYERSNYDFFYHQEHAGADHFPPLQPEPAACEFHRQNAGAAFSLSKFAFNSDDNEQHITSPGLAPSSPAYNASQRHTSTHAGKMTEIRPNQLATDGGAVWSVAPRASSGPSIAVQQHGSHGCEAAERSTPAYVSKQPQPAPRRIDAAPIVQGIELISTNELPDRFRSIFPFPLFNAVQSKCFGTIYGSNDNFVLSSPTGSGKTAVLELAICRLINGFSNGSFKIVYQAPTKSLCAERQRDWQRKFGPLDLHCAELTGDTENMAIKDVQRASIIITTPEKWDSMTRKWKDNQRLFEMVKLFLIDEVHILKEERGATLEAVVSRMKSVGSNVRFVALSATVPNSDDIATWLGKEPTAQHLPAAREKFGEEFRPVKLQKHVCGYQGSPNDFAFEKLLNTKLPDVISKYSQKKPIMIFCFTRASCVETAKLLATWWSTKGPRERYWSAPHQQIAVGEKDLRETIASGVAFHHAGLQLQDRNIVEQGFLNGEINVICCTSTLAVGVNLPCHMVIIKNTISYNGPASGGCKEYSDLEIMQMLGRAGRPQFDSSAVAVIMTRLHRMQYYEKMMNGQEVLESSLHRNLIDHLNAEIGSGTIINASSAKRWLSGTFLYVRLKANPEHYSLTGDGPDGNLEERLVMICENGIGRLQEHKLVSANPSLHCTEFGDAMARYYIQFDTMKVLLAIPAKAKISEILSAIAQAAEFKDIRFRSGEKASYKDLNTGGSIKFPIPVNIDQPAHKVSLIIQAVLAAVDLPTDDYKHTADFNPSKAAIFQHANRLVRCIIDCKLYLNDAVSARNALMLARSLSAQVWDDSPLHIKQLEGVGPVLVRKLAAAGIKTVEDIENTDAHRLEHAVSRNPPFGAQLQEKAKAFPSLRVSLKAAGEPVVKRGEHVTLRVKADLGFLNERVPETYHKRPVYVCMLAETSDGEKVHFVRVSAKRMSKGLEIPFSVNLTSPTQTIRVHVMCDEIAGTARHAFLKPTIPSAAFPAPKKLIPAAEHSTQLSHAPNTCKRRISAGRMSVHADGDSDEFGDAGIDDHDLELAAADDFVDIDDLACTQPKSKKRRTSNYAQANADWEPRQLANGKWACNHACKDKTACKHLCCREGLDKKPKPPKAKESKESKKQASEPGSDPRQTQLNLGPSKKASTTAPKFPVSSTQSKMPKSKAAQDLSRLHDSIKTSTPHVPLLPKKKPDERKDDGSKTAGSGLKFDMRGDSSDYGLNSSDADELAHVTNQVQRGASSRKQPIGADARGAGDDMLDEEFEDGLFDHFHTHDMQTSTLHSNVADQTDGVDTAQVPGDGWDINDFNDDSAVPMELPKALPTGDGNRKAIFISNSSEKPAVSDFNHAIEFEPHNDYGDDFIYPTTPKTSVQPLATLEEIAHPEIDLAFANGNTGQDAGLIEETPPPPPPASSPDEIEKWFREEFGTEKFNFIR